MIILKVTASQFPLSLEDTFLEKQHFNILLFLDSLIG